jgi:hypothetical protein
VQQPQSTLFPLPLFPTSLPLSRTKTLEEAWSYTGTGIAASQYRHTGGQREAQAHSSCSREATTPAREATTPAKQHNKAECPCVRARRRSLCMPNYIHCAPAFMRACFAACVHASSAHLCAFARAPARAQA